MLNRRSIQDKKQLKKSQLNRNARRAVESKKKTNKSTVYKMKRTAG